MQVRGSFAAAALAALLALPTLASASIVQRWQSSPAQYAVIANFEDFAGDGHYEMLTEEASAPGVKIGVRSTSTGALLAQTVGVYQPGQFWVTYLEPTNQVAEIIFSDKTTGNMVCVNYTTGATTLPVRWSFLPVAGGLYSLSTFIDFDGNGQLSMVFKDEHTSTFKYYIYDNNGAPVTTIDQTAQVAGTYSVSLLANAFENVNRQSLMIWYHSQTSSDVVYLFASNAPPPPGQAPASATSESRPVRAALPKLRTFVPDHGSWAEASLPDLAATATPHAVTLP